MKVSRTEIKSTIYGLYDLDAIDKRIIKYLQKNGRESFAKIAEEIGVPPSTVRDRTKRMIESGVLQIVALLNPLQAEQRTTATIGVKLAAGNHQAVANEMAEFEEVTHLVICAGSFDLLVELTCKDHAHLLDIVSQVQGMSQVQHAETFIHFSTVKEALAGGPF
jgi:Lrp/AsnC family transcriptional regulator for asnA, asnC and gidA